MKFTHILIITCIAFLSCDTSNNKKEEQKDNLEQVEEKPRVEVPENQKLTMDQQITSAVLAAPKEGQENARVYGYDEDGNFVTLREGANNFVCIADDPSKDGFQIVSYHISLEPMMSRGRELASEGKSRGEKEEIRAREAKSGDLKLPEVPATLHIYYGENGFFNTETNQIENAKYRYVVYMPYATQDATGLSLKPNESSHPWLMFPGKYNAHIMITPSE
jgi:hypothetical protein